MTLQSPFDTQALVEAGARLSKPGDCLSNLIIDLTNCAWFDISTTEIFSMIDAKKKVLLFSTGKDRSRRNDP